LAITSRPQIENPRSHRENPPQIPADYLSRISRDYRDALHEETARDPFGGVGKPEPLRGELSGWWSKRIDQEHRLVYQVEGERLIIAQARGHYDD
jgi:Txe/YoeB family toxin of toxin-antitoxin system